MKAKRLLTCGTLIAALIAMTAPALSAQPDVVPGRYIIVLREFADPDLAAADMRGTYALTVHHVYRHALRGFAAVVPDAFVQALRNDQRVRFVVPDRIMQAFQVRPPRPPRQQGQILPTGVNRIDADLNTIAKINNIDERVNRVVAIVDTGIANHPDLNREKIFNCLLPGECVEGLGSDDNGHGTHVAGTVGAIDNTTGVVGVAPGVRLWGYKVLNALGFGFLSDIAKAVDHIAANASTIDAFNMSLGGAGSDDGNCGNTNGDVLHMAVCNAVGKGVVGIVAAGNAASNAAATIPAAYDEVITVSAFADSDGQGGGLGGATPYGPDDTMASFSNFGGDVDIASPGVGIFSTYLNGTYRNLSGTSMASPHVAGSVALYIEAHGKPTDLAGVLAIRAALIALGECFPGATNTGTSCTSKWPGDRDTNPAFFEPLLDAASL